MAKAKKYIPNHITLYTDASWAQDVGSWAFWARSDHGRHMLSSLVPNDIKNIHEAETYAVCQGMHKCLRKWPMTKGFFVFTDSMATINLLKGGKSKNDTLMRLKVAFDKMVKEHNLDITLRHVRAHKNPNRSTRNWLNNWCDKSAKKSRMEHEKERNKTEGSDDTTAQGIIRKNVTINQTDVE